MSSHPCPTMASSALRSIPYLSAVKIFRVSPGKVLTFSCREHANNNDSPFWPCAIFRSQSVLTSVSSLDFSSGSVRKARQIISPALQTEPSEAGTKFLPILQVRKQRHEEIKKHAQDDNTRKRESWDVNPGSQAGVCELTHCTHHLSHISSASFPHLEKIWVHSRSLRKTHWIRG